MFVWNHKLVRTFFSQFYNFMSAIFTYIMSTAQHLQSWVPQINLPNVHVGLDGPWSSDNKITHKIVYNIISYILYIDIHSGIMHTLAYTIQKTMKETVGVFAYQPIFHHQPSFIDCTLHCLLLKCPPWNMPPSIRAPLTEGGTRPIKSSMTCHSDHRTWVYLAGQLNLMDIYIPKLKVILIWCLKSKYIWYYIIIS